MGEGPANKLHVHVELAFLWGLAWSKAFSHPFFTASRGPGYIDGHTTQNPHSRRRGIDEGMDMGIAGYEADCIWLYHSLEYRKRLISTPVVRVTYDISCVVLVMQQNCLTSIFQLR